MSTAFDSYSKPTDQRRLDEPRTAFGALSSQQNPDYQSVQQLAQSTATNTNKAKLDQNRHGSYLSYIDQVVNAELPSDEGAARASYIPNTFGSSAGTNFINPNAAMAGGAVPAAYEFAGLKNGEFDYGVDRLEWGGPASGRRTPNDWLDRGRINQGRNQAEDALRRAIIPEYLRQDVSNRLANQWTQGWGQEFQNLANDRRMEQANWWGGSNWANNSFRPGWTEEISPAERRELSPFIPGRPGVDPIPYQPAIPARRELVTPEQTAIEAVHRLVSPEVQGREAIAAGYYTPNQSEYDAWVQQEQQRQQNDQYQQFRVYDSSGNAVEAFGMNLTNPALPPNWSQLNGRTYETSPVFQGSQADAWQDEFARHQQNLRDLYPFWQNQFGLFNLDPTSPNNGFYRNDQAYGGQGRIVNTFTDGTSVDAFGNAFNSDLGYSYFGDETDTLKVASLFPEIWGNYQPGQEAIAYQPAVYEDIPGREYRPAVYSEIPGQPERAFVPGITAIPDTPARYLDIPAVTTDHPMEPKDGFTTLIDPITGTAIPNWWLNGGLGSNQDLAETYGDPQWYIR